MPEQAVHSSILVQGLCCATEESLIRKKLSSLAGIQELALNLVTHRLEVNHTCSQGEILSALKDIGLPGSVRRESSLKSPSIPRTPLYVTIAAGVLFAAGLVVDRLTASSMAASTLFMLSIVVSGWRVMYKAFKSAVHFSLDMNVLMTVAVAGALAIGQAAEGAAVMLLFAVSLLLEAMSVLRTRQSLESLLNLSPPQATVRVHGSETAVPASEVKVGTTIIVRPGERVALDGIVTHGTSTLNQSAITGESMPVVKNHGDLVFAGSLNQRGTLEIRSTKAAENSTLARIIHLVEEAQSRKAPTQSFVETFARYYTPSVFVIALLLMSVPPLLFSASFADWFYRALVLLVIACPCALVISTPVAIVSALTSAARNGVLIKGGKHLETLARVKAVALDKTGTLTVGSADVTDIIPTNSLDHIQVLRLIAAIEQRSEHHLADALLRRALAEQVDLDSLTIDQFEAVTGKGVRATIDGRRYIVGNHPFLEELGLCSPAVESVLHKLEEHGKTTVILADEQGALGIIGIADRVRQESKDTVDAIRNQGVDRVVLLTGDNRGSARSISAEMSLDETQAELLPEQKLDAVRELRSRYSTVAMVGDGVNDAPAMAAADVGIAMGVVGSDTALETADIVLMSDNLTLIPATIRLGRQALAIIRQNIALALGIKLLFLGLGTLGLASLWLAIFADDGVTLLVILNSLRLLRPKSFSASG